MMSMRKRIVIAVVLLIVCYVLYTRPKSVRRDHSYYHVETKIDAGANRSITILVSDEAFETPAWYFEINEGSQIVVPTTFISGCCLGEKLKFKLFTSSDQSLVGLVSERRPEVLLLVHDFNSGENWPRGEFDDGWQTTLERGRRLRDRLQADHRQLDLKLSHEVP